MGNQSDTRTSNMVLEGQKMKEFFDTITADLNNNPPSSLLVNAGYTSAIRELRKKSLVDKKITVNTITKIIETIPSKPLVYASRAPDYESKKISEEALGKIKDYLIEKFDEVAETHSQDNSFAERMKNGHQLGFSPT